ncbi:MAG: NAD-dependent deacylase [Thermodesulfobacteriota bacterium]
MEERIREAADIIVNSRLTIALTGAGVSVESGIPDFRSSEGLWARYDPAEYATIDAFRRDPEKVWNMLREMEDLVVNARPNAAHIGMGELERMGFLHHVITQNIDNLHQAGGSRNVIEYHGNSSTLSCIWCGKHYTLKEVEGPGTPRCACSKPLKPDVVFFGEAIPVDALNRSIELASRADAVLIVGTSAMVSPANTIPMLAGDRGAKLIEINKERTHLSESLTDVFLSGNAGDVVTELVAAVREKATKGV